MRRVAEDEKLQLEGVVEGAVDLARLGPGLADPHPRHLGPVELEGLEVGLEVGRDDLGVLWQQRRGRCWWWWWWGGGGGDGGVLRVQRLVARRVEHVAKGEVDLAARLGQPDA